MLKYSLTESLIDDRIARKVHSTLSVGLKELKRMMVRGYRS